MRKHGSPFDGDEIPYLLGDNLIILAIMDNIRHESLKLLVPTC